MVEQGRWDMQEYHRRIKLTVYFMDKKEKDPPPFTLKSSWTPPLAQLPAEVTTLIGTDTKHFDDKFRAGRIRPNLNKEEKTALNEIKNNKNIIIKPADKGSAVVIMDRDQYVWEGHRQLQDTKYYTKLQEPIYPETTKLIKPIIEKLVEKKFINSKQKNYLLGNPEPRARLFYLLPKIHKDPSNWSKPYEIPPGRPIVSDCGSETYFTAEYLDYFLNPLSVRHDSYIKDTYDFINKVKQLHIPTEAILFTMDVDSLYTNIDIDEGIQAIKNIFTKYRDKKRPDKELLQLLDINLRKNDFEFDKEFYLQIKGTAMGKKFAPAYANIFMAEWETSALAACPKKPLHYYRFLDDIWGVWPHSRGDFEEFLTSLNNHNPSIKLKATTNDSTVDFLDTTTYKGPNFHKTNILETKVFFKETDTHALLHKNSYHPRHTFAGLVKSQLLRFHRICSHKDDFMLATKTLFRALSTRGYSRSFLRSALKTFQVRKPIQVSSVIPLVTTFSSPAVKLVKTLRNNFINIIDQSGTLQDHRIIAAFRKNKNLRDYLVRARLRPSSTRKSTSLGNFYSQKTWIHGKNNNRVHKTLAWGNPHTRNCVYLITCSKCGAQYVGETKNSLLVRFTQHRYNILRQKETHTPLVKHFLQHGWPSVKASVIQQNPNWSAAQRVQAERVWITKLDTLHPRGLNQK